MSQLDGLRAFAVGAVLIHHFFQPARIGGVDLALLGVWLFFVLSGFLITGILLRSRDQVDYSGYPSGFVLRQFYVRRFLRIFPLYYAVLFMAATILEGIFLVVQGFRGLFNRERHWTLDVDGLGNYIGIAQWVLVYLVLFIYPYLGH